MNWWFTKWPTGDHAVYSRREMEQMLQNAGFTDISSKLITPLFTEAELRSIEKLAPHNEPIPGWLLYPAQGAIWFKNGYRWYVLPAKYCCRHIDNLIQDANIQLSQYKEKKEEEARHGRH